MRRPDVCKYYSNTTILAIDSLFKQSPTRTLLLNMELRFPLSYPQLDEHTSPTGMNLGGSEGLQQEREMAKVLLRFLPFHFLQKRSELVAIFLPFLTCTKMDWQEKQEAWFNCYSKRLLRSFQN